MADKILMYICLMLEGLLPNIVNLWYEIDNSHLKGSIFG